MPQSRAQSILLLSCSASKLPRVAPALELYRGTMYSTYRANVRQNAQPQVIILSAKHGFIPAETVIEPYDQLLTRDRADMMLSQLDGYMHGLSPVRATSVMLAGGAEYRRVMRAAVNRLIEKGLLATNVAVSETSGGIGFQRQQLGAYLRRLTPPMAVVGQHLNGTPLYTSLDGLAIDQEIDVVYANQPGRRPAPAVIQSLFNGPSGPTAEVLMLGDSAAPSSRWVRLQDIRAK